MVHSRNSDNNKPEINSTTASPDHIGSTRMLPGRLTMSVVVCNDVSRRVHRPPANTKKKNQLKNVSSTSRVVGDVSILILEIALTLNWCHWRIKWSKHGVHAWIMPRGSFGRERAGRGCDSLNIGKNGLFRSLASFGSAVLISNKLPRRYSSPHT